MPNLGKKSARKAHFSLGQAQAQFATRKVEQIPDPIPDNPVTDKGNTKGSGWVQYTTATGKRAWRRAKQGAGYVKRKAIGAGGAIGAGAKYTWGGTQAAGKRIGQGGKYVWGKVQKHPKLTAGAAGLLAVGGAAAYLVGRKRDGGYN